MTWCPPAYPVWVRRFDACLGYRAIELGPAVRHGSAVDLIRSFLEDGTSGGADGRSGRHGTAWFLDAASSADQTPVPPCLKAPDGQWVLDNAGAENPSSHAPGCFRFVSTSHSKCPR